MSRRTKIVLGLIGVLIVMIGSAILMPVPLAHIQLPPEPIAVIAGAMPFTNTMLSTLLADIIIIVLALLMRRKMSEVPHGIQNVFEAVYEFWENMSHQMIGKEKTVTYLPLIFGMFVFILVANWIELLPGWDSVGILCESGTCPGEPEGLTVEGIEHTYFKVNYVSWLGGIGNAYERAEKKNEHEEEHGSAGHGEGVALGGGQGGESSGSGLFTAVAHASPAAADVPTGEDAPDAVKVLVPFLRVSASDLNFTLAIALVSFFFIELVGFRAHGIGYLGKFFTFKGFPMGTFVGLLEFISEIARIISFTFRLFGNIFAGMILLLVIPFLVPLLMVIPVYALELFVGLIQAFVFAVLTLAFMGQAAESHDH